MSSAQLERGGLGADDEQPEELPLLNMLPDACDDEDSLFLLPSASSPDCSLDEEERADVGKAEPGRAVT